MLTYLPPSQQSSPFADLHREHSWWLLLLCAAWLIPGTFGHAPWRPEEAEVIGVVHHLLTQGGWLLPTIADQPYLTHPPLVYWLASALGWLFSPWLLPLHEAVRLLGMLFMAAVFLFAGLTGRALWGPRHGRSVVLLMMGCIGLLSRAHLVMVEQGGLFGAALFLWGTTLYPDRPRLSGLVSGLGAGVAFLSVGAPELLPLVLAMLFLPFADRRYRERTYFLQTLPIAVLSALPFVLLWPAWLYHLDPALFADWWRSAGFPPQSLWFKSLPYYAGILPWFAWPAWLLALWPLLRSKGNPEQRAIAGRLVGIALLWWLSLGFQVEHSDVHADLLLLPLCLIAAPSLDRLARGSVAALNWFGLASFGVFAALIWTGWVALTFGMPARLAARMVKASPTFNPQIRWGLLLFAVVLTVGWLAAVFRSRLNGRMALTNWAAGATAVWGLVMTLWLPWISAAKDYRPALLAMASKVPAHQCIDASRISDTAQALLDYYALPEVRTSDSARGCHYVARQESRQEKAKPQSGWRQIWEGGRPTDKRVVYRLYRRD